jgi:hypothetical protein
VVSDAQAAQTLFEADRFERNVKLHMAEEVANSET